MISTIALQVLHRLELDLRILVEVYWSVGWPIPIRTGSSLSRMVTTPLFSSFFSFPLLFSFLVVFGLALKIYTGLELKLSNAKQCV